MYCYYRDVQRERWHFGMLEVTTCTELNVSDTSLYIFYSMYHMFQRKKISEVERLLLVLGTFFWWSWSQLFFAFSLRLGLIFGTWRFRLGGISRFLLEMLLMYTLFIDVPKHKWATKTTSHIYFYMEVNLGRLRERKMLVCESSRKQKCTAKAAKANMCRHVY